MYIDIFCLIPHYKETFPHFTPEGYTVECDYGWTKISPVVLTALLDDSRFGRKIFTLHPSQEQEGLANKEETPAEPKPKKRAKK